MTGAAIATTILGLVDPEHLVGLHVNMVVAGPPTGEGVNPLEGLSDTEMQALNDMNHFREEETGYQAIQGTKPQTLGYALTDSPAGLAGLDRREVPHVERLRRRRRVELQQGSAAHQHHGVLGHEHDLVVGSPLLRVAAVAALRTGV